MKLGTNELYGKDILPTQTLNFVVQEKKQFLRTVSYEYCVAPYTFHFAIHVDSEK